MIKNIINLVLLVLVVFLAYVLYKSIEEPVAFKSQLDTRKNAVVDKLLLNRKAQELYRGITGQYAPSYDTMFQVFNTGKFKIISVFGDPDNVDNPTPISYDTLFVSAKDSVLTVLGIPFDSLKYVPYSNGKIFEVYADTITYQKTLVQVCEVKTTFDSFMGKYKDEKYQKYDDRYNPTATIKFGDKSKPSLSGNWE